WGRCMIEHTAEFRPLAGAPQRRKNAWNIGMAHGFHLEDRFDQGRASPITPSEIAASGFDYLALGHVHVHRQFRHGDTLACYPGAPLASSLGSHADGCVMIVDL